MLHEQVLTHRMHHPRSADCSGQPAAATLQFLPGYTLQDLLLILVQAHSEGRLETDNLDLVYFYLGHADLLMEKESE